MTYKVLEQFDPETQQLMTKYMDAAGVSDLKVKSDFEKFFVAMMDDYIEKKLSLEDLSWLCGRLWVIITYDLKITFMNNSSLYDLGSKFLDMDDIVGWELENDPDYDGGLTLGDTIELYRELKK